jgi:hypothetical protein
MDQLANQLHHIAALNERTFEADYPTDRKMIAGTPRGSGKFLTQINAAENELSV